MTEKSNDPGLKDGARRKLVRGVFAVPAVLTLHSGSALAATSANSCLVRQNLSPITNEPPASFDDRFFRYQLLDVRPRGGGTPQSSWISGADLDPFKRAGNKPFLGRTYWQQFDPVSNKLVGTPTLSPPPYDSATQELARGKFVVLQVDKMGDIVGAGASGSGSAVGDSCWNSFATRTA